MRSSLRSPSRLFGLLATLLLVLPAAAFSQKPIAKVENLGDALLFSPRPGFEQLILTVTGPCDFQYRQVVTEGDGLFRLDETTIDGVYTFNLMREEPIDPGIVKLLQTARQRFDEETPRALCRDGKLPGPPISQSAGFRVSQRRIIYNPSAQEPRGKSAGSAAGPQGLAAPITSISAADFVINDDLIVDGSACIGFDCVNGEVFGFDTLRLKENNLRIKFDDTSVAASFPRNDWQLTANESANGGASKFSIEDISGARTPFTVEANARSHSLYVDDGGRIGSRTSTPSVEIHTIDGDTPTLRLQQDGSSGFAPQTWDVAGNETNFFVRDVTNGSALPFRIRPGAPTSSIFIDVDGDVGLGTSSPDSQLHVSRSGIVLADVESTNNNAVQIRMKTDSTNRRFLAQNASGTTQSQIIFNDSEIRFAGTTDSGSDLYGILNTNGLITLGATCNPGPCDGTFKSDFEVPTIEEHAEFMWTNSHLWGVGPTPEGAPINLSKKTTGILHELEVAHIYIEELHSTIESMRGTMEDMRVRLQRLEDHED